MSTVGEKLPGKLFVVATPIGNLGDITERAMDTLQIVDTVACEDTRRTRELFAHFGFHAFFLSCRVQNEKLVSKKVIEILRDGRHVAYCSDAGTPGVSDPGAVLVNEVRKAGFCVVPIPGASAVTTILSVAGVGKSFLFDGFLSIKSGKRRKRLLELKKVLDMDCAIVLYESPFRVLKLLADIADIYGESKVIIGRELTKLHEEIIEGTAEEIITALSARPSIKGEFAVVIAPK